MTVAEAEVVVRSPVESRALDLLLEASRLSDRADALLIRDELCEAVPAALKKLEAAIAAREAAEQAPKPLEATLAQLKARQDQETARLDAARKVLDVPADDVATYLAISGEDRHNARRDLQAAEAELADLRPRIGLVSNALSPLLAALRDARMAEDVARAEGDAIAAAVEDPLWHPRARDTAAYRDRMKRLCPVILPLDWHPEWPDAYEALKKVAVASGLAEHLQRDAITALSVGDPAAVAAAAQRTALPSGHTVISESGKPSIVYQHQATPGAVASALPLPVGDGRTGGQVVTDAWANSGFAHQSQPGLPGAHGATAIP